MDAPKRTALRARDGAKSESALRRTLLGWYRRNARRLPWRTTKDPYAIWVSEVMLQQTQVATVVPYYRRFLRAFPNLTSLARAPRERVLELWSGLGYYRRARHLHLAAQTLARKFDATFPRDYRLARTLPGIGDYTARAVLSLAYDLPYYVLDGNVGRVVARLRALRGSLNQPAFRRAVEGVLDRLLSRRQPGNFNQAVMELGQAVCLPRAPRCPACPIRKWCRAYRLGRPESYPSPRSRRATESLHLATGVVHRDHKVMLVRGLDDGLLEGLWNFPSAFGKSQSGAVARLKEKLAGLAQSQVRIGEPFAELRHGITYRSMRVHLYPVEFDGKNFPSSARWFRVARLKNSATSQLARKVGACLA